MTDIPINFTLELVDNISATVNRVESSIEGLEKKMDTLIESSGKQEISFLAQVQAVRSIDMGFRGLVNVGSELGLVTGGLEKGLHGVSVAVHGVSAAFQLLKGARQVLIMLRSAEVGVATVEAFRAGLKGKLGLVVLGLSVAAGAGGYLAGRSSVENTTTVNQSVTIGTGYASNDTRATAAEVLDALGGE